MTDINQLQFSVLKTGVIVKCMKFYLAKQHQAK